MDSMATFSCNKNPDHYFTRISNSLDNRLPCIKCDGWMYPVDSEPYAYKKPNVVWSAIGHVIWFFLKPIDNWIQKHDREEDK